MARAASLCFLLVLAVSVLSPVTNAQDSQPLAAKVGRYVYVPDDTVVSVYTVNSKGQWRTNGFVPEDQNFTYWSSRIDPLGRFFYGMTNISCNAISVFSIASATGRLTPVAGSPFATFSLAGAQFSADALTVTPNGKFLYSLGNEAGTCGSNNISGLFINPTTGALTAVPGSPFSDGERPLRGVVDSQSKFLFVADATPDKISVFTIDPTTGALTAVTGSPFSICGPSCTAAYVVLSPSDAVLYALLDNPNMRIAAFTVNGTTGGLAPLTGSPFPLFGASPTGLTIDPLGRQLFVSDGLVNAAIWAFNINPQTGVPVLVPTSPFLAQFNVESVATDPKGNFVYAPSYSSYDTQMFKVDHSTGGLKSPTNIRGPHGPKAAWFSTGASAVTYVPKFAYVANSGSTSISEYSFNSNGTLQELTGSPLSDSNGPISVAATPSGAFVYTVDANHKISGYSVGASGTLTAVTGSPFSGFTAPAAVATDPSNTYVFVVDQGTTPNPGTIWMEKIGSNGALSPANSAPNHSNTPTAAAMAPGSDYLFVLNSAEKTIAGYQASYALNAPSIGGPNGTASTGNGPSAAAVDPSSNFVYVTNSADGTVSAYKISDGTDGHNQGTPVPVAKSPFAAGTSPSAVVAEPSGKYLYVANSGSNNIFAYKIKATTGALTKIAGSFPTGSAPDSLTVSNDGKFLYASNKSSGSVSVFTINANGTLTSGTDSPTGTSPTSIASTGTTQ